MTCFFRDGYQMKPVVVRPVVRVRHLWLLIAACIVLYAEWWDPDSQSSRWPHMPPEQLCRSGCLRLLLVADAHVAGEQSEPGWPLGAITRWDSDRYLRRSFQRALEHVLPDVVVFLGDTMDGGEQATSEQLERYSHRFWSIFSVPRNVKVVSVPEPHVSSIVDSTPYSSDTRRFIKVFGNSNSNIVDFIQFYKVFSSQDLYNVTTAPLVDGINILISHLPITTSILEHKASMLLRTRTNLVFSAHNHNSYIAIQGKTNGAVHRMQGMLGSQLEDISLQDDNVVEIVVPTCSYRKGMRRMGLGAAIVDRVGAIKYTVLWLPSRYKHLALYLSASLCCAVIVIGWYCCRRRRGLVQVRRTRYHDA